jgi:hypothetical protein
MSKRDLALVWIGFALALIIVILNEIRCVWEDSVGLRRLEAHLEQRRLEKEAQ